MFLFFCMHIIKGRWWIKKKKRLKDVLEMGSLLYCSGNPSLIPKPLIWVELHNMFGFDWILVLFCLGFFATKPQSILKKESKGEKR